MGRRSEFSVINSLAHGSIEFLQAIFPIRLSAFCPCTINNKPQELPLTAAHGACYCWVLPAILGPGHERFLNGIQEVEGSIPFGSTKNPQQIRYLVVRDDGAQGFGVICRARGLHEKPRVIAAYEQNALVRLSALTEDKRPVYAKGKWVPLAELNFSSRATPQGSRSRSTAKTAPRVRS